MGAIKGRLRANVSPGLLHITPMIFILLSRPPILLSLFNLQAIARHHGTLCSSAATLHSLMVLQVFGLVNPNEYLDYLTPCEPDLALRVPCFAQELLVVPTSRGF